MSNQFQLLLYRLHCINRAIFLFYAHHLLLHFHLFNIAQNVSIILDSLIAIILFLILILILFIHLTVTHINHLNHIFTLKQILTLTGNLTPGFLVSVAPSRRWDGSVLIDTVLFCYHLISFFSCFVSSRVCISFRYPTIFGFPFFFFFFSWASLLVLRQRGRCQKEGGRMEQW